MLMLQHNNPHHFHISFEGFYWFLILAPILTALVLYSGVKLMNFFEKHRD